MCVCVCLFSANLALPSSTELFYFDWWNAFSTGVWYQAIQFSIELVDQSLRQRERSIREPEQGSIFYSAFAVHMYCGPGIKLGEGHTIAAVLLI